MMVLTPLPVLFLWFFFKKPFARFLLFPNIHVCRQVVFELTLGLGKKRRYLYCDVSSSFQESNVSGIRNQNESKKNKIIGRKDGKINMEGK